MEPKFSKTVNKKVIFKENNYFIKLMKKSTQFNSNCLQVK